MRHGKPQPAGRALAACRALRLPGPALTAVLHARRPAVTVRQLAVRAMLVGVRAGRANHAQASGTAQGLLCHARHAYSRGRGCAGAAARTRQQRCGGAAEEAANVADVGAHGDVGQPPGDRVAVRQDDACAASLFGFLFLLSLLRALSSHAPALSRWQRTAWLAAVRPA